MPEAPTNLSKSPQRVGAKGFPLNSTKKPMEFSRVTLTDQQRLFVKEWAQGNSVLAAANRAGYQDNGAYAYRLVKNPTILALYEKEKKQYEIAGVMSKKKVMDMLQESYDMAKMMSEPSSMVAAARELGKMCGYYAPTEARIKIEGNLVVEKMNRLSDAELLEVIEQANHQVTALVEGVVEEMDDAASVDGQDDPQALGRATQLLEDGSAGDPADE